MPSRPKRPCSYPGCPRLTDGQYCEDHVAVAIEIALGAAMQQIVVGTEQDGKAVLAFLKRTNSGRVTVLPLSTIQGKALQERDNSRWGVPPYCSFRVRGCTMNS